MNTQEINVATEAAYDHISTRHVSQFSGNGREDGQKGKSRRVKSWDSEIVIDNQQKSGVREQSIKNRAHDFTARRAKEHAARRWSRAEEERYRSSKTNNKILFGYAGLAFGKTT
jgi:hypothetical protein